MNPICNVVAERVALGEDLGEHEAHTKTCERCMRVVALPSSLVSTGHAADPGMGFASRMMAGAQHRITVRRRQRYTAVASVAAAAAAMIAMFVMREPEVSSVAYVPVELLPHLPAISPVTNKDDPWKPHEADEDVRALVHLANVDRSRHISAHWGRIEKSLAPYRAVLKGSEP
ncbi:MAG TPA: hypothetical protein VF403_21455 [Kofleriaceae bacterium]